MRSHGVLDFPILKQGPGGSLVHPLNPPAWTLTSPGYDAAFRACLKLAVTSGGGRFAARYRAMALEGLKQAECMRAQGITDYPSPATLGGGLHAPRLHPTLGIDTHTLAVPGGRPGLPVWDCPVADGVVVACRVDPAMTRRCGTRRRLGPALPGGWLRPW